MEIIHYFYSCSGQEIRNFCLQIRAAFLFFGLRYYSSNLLSLSLVCEVLNNCTSWAIFEKPYLWIATRGDSNYTAPMQKPAKVLIFLSGPPNAVGSKSDCESRGRWFEPQSSHILSLRFGHEKISTTILTLPLIQEGQLSVTGIRMDTKYW